jgi:hypothetical protein
MTVLLSAGRGAKSDEVLDRPPRPPRPSLPLRQAVSVPRGDLILVLGAEGTPEYGRTFEEWEAAWRQAAERGPLRVTTVGQVGGESAELEAARHDARVKDSLRHALHEAAQELDLPLWIVMIGHGTFDGRSARFNLVGEDVTEQELAQWLEPLRRPTAIVQCASASGEFLPALSAAGRVVVTATKSGAETNFARFGGFLSAAIADPAADLDKDGQVSLLEAFLRAARQTEEHYAGQGLLATEHALLDDNGDGRGTRAEAFTGLRPVRQADSGATLDGYLAHQWTLVPSDVERQLSPEFRRRRDALERDILRLRELKGTLAEEEYYSRLEPLLIELARLYEQAERDQAAAPPASDGRP